jgi:S-adenosylmethionine decarboxylase
MFSLWRRKKTNFGVHLTIDGYKGNREKLNNFELVYNLLNQLPDEIDIQKLMPPYVVIAPPVTEKDQGGISGFIIIAESHISIHTFPEKRFVSIDVYTCRNNLDVEKVKTYLKEIFLLEELEVNIIERGTKFFLS